jgi:hypothetical protein
MSMSLQSGTHESLRRQQESMVVKEDSGDRALDESGYNLESGFLEFIARIPGLAILPRRGRNMIAQGIALGTVMRRIVSPERAGHGHGDVAPFQGWGIDLEPVPRAMPWADLWLPLRGDRPCRRYHCSSVVFCPN